MSNSIPTFAPPVLVLLPFGGSLHRSPTYHALCQEELVFHEWAKPYGDVMYFRVLGRDIIVLDSVQAATELLEKRSELYSDRPNFAVYTSYDRLKLSLPIHLRTEYYLLAWIIMWRSSRTVVVFGSTANPSNHCSPNNPSSSFGPFS
ncbi:hypothetical protein PTI98_002448 [Pleurotus ostreatus]|nr:hypothetical protein PTI98_002448 [Pleurotus ostreatus]